MNSEFGMWGLIPVEAQGRTWFADLSLEFMEGLRTLINLRLVCRDTHDIEEVWIKCIRQSRLNTIFPIMYPLARSVSWWGAALGEFLLLGIYIPCFVFYAFLVYVCSIYVEPMPGVSLCMGWPFRSVSFWASTLAANQSGTASVLAFP